ncbi:alpha/beta fold hydrolase [Phycicoccus flavus]|uniref:alpha/beta fold hydrolase n=1 Tax=Phycicoccus flavus TaxID=2502783 RepID=UPI000FEC1FD3|nr:alpha/beta hydrolase [Phycicoccus flavus]NHA68994.1 alpha/beta hydrolase [Phycicoccus flavus]
MPTVELPAGPLQYGDTGGEGPVLVLCHGVPMDGRCWRRVVPLLPGFRVLTPTLPLGGHRLPMRQDAELGQAGVATVLADFIDALGLEDVTLVLNDWGGGQLIINAGRTERVGRLVLATCEAFDNFPPAAARPMVLLARSRLAWWLFLQTMRLGAVRRMRSGYGGISVAGDIDDLVRDWFGPALGDRRVRRDFARFVQGSPPPAEMLRLSDQWRRFDRPVLVLWGADDRLMPPEHAQRLVDHYPDARLVVLERCSTLVGEDRPEEVARLLTEFATRDVVSAS